MGQQGPEFVPTWYTIWVFLTLLRWKHHDIGLEFQDFDKIRLMNEYLTSKFLLLLTPLVHEIRVWAWVDDVSTLSQNFKFWKNGFIKEEFTLKYPRLWFSSLYQHWYMKYQFGPFWPNVWLMTSSRESKSDLKNSIKYWFRYFYHPRYMIYNFGLFLPFADNDVTKEINSQEFWKIN